MLFFCVGWREGIGPGCSVFLRHVVQERRVAILVMPFAVSCFRLWITCSISDMPKMLVCSVFFARSAVGPVFTQCWLLIVNSVPGIVIDVACRT